jgi:hypothetical protein
MPLAGIGIGLGTALAGGAAAGASLYGAHKQSSAATKAAQMQVDAANHAADLQKQSNDAALAFQKEQAARDQAMAEATRHGNYDLEAARVGRLGSLADLIGAQHPQMPGYVPLEGAPAASGGPAPASAAAPVAFRKRRAISPRISLSRIRSPAGRASPRAIWIIGRRRGTRKTRSTSFRRCSGWMPARRTRRRWGRTRVARREQRHQRCDPRTSTARWARWRRHHRALR